jgi:type II secretory pathway predicted ATPase ExeA
MHPVSVLARGEPLDTDEKLDLLGRYLSPENPIRLTEFLRGRENELQALEQELRHFRAIPFIFGDRGVGKTSLARTVAQQVTKSDREHIYVACAPGARMLSILREIAMDLLAMAVRLGDVKEITRKIELNLSANPGIKMTIESRKPQLEPFADVNAAVRTLRDVEQLLTDARTTVVIIDELEELNDDDRRDLAFLVKQLGDQEFAVKYVLVGIAENVQQLIGAHESVPRYIKEVSLEPLSPHVLMEIVKQAAGQVHVTVDEEILIRIAIIGNGYPHFAHLMGKALLTGAVVAESSEITPPLYAKGVERAVNESIQQLRMSYDTATQRRDDIYKHLLWALAHNDTVDIRIDDWIRVYLELARRELWPDEPEARLQDTITLFSEDRFGAIVVNTPIRYGSQAIRYRYKRFANSLMRGHVRLQAEREGVQLGQRITL